MKRAFSAAISLILAAVIGFSCIPFAFAAEPTCEFSLGETTAHIRAKSATVPLNIKSEAPLTFSRVTITLPDFLTFVGITKKASGLSIEVREIDSSTICLDIDPTNSSITEGALCTLKFEIGSDAVRPSKTNIALAAEAEGVAIGCHDGTLTISDKIMYGDVNSDNAINTKDITETLKRLANDSYEIDIVCADVNLDQKLNAKDVLQILKHMVGIETARLGHRDMIETIEEATCQRGGKVRLTCMYCGDTTIANTPTVSHKFENGKCTMCAKKHPDYGVIAYTDYLKNNGRLELSLRGFALYETMQKSDYTLFSSNICDSKTGALVIFGVGTLKNSLSCSISLEISSVSTSYRFHYYADLGSKQIAKAEGTISPSGIIFDDFTGSDDKKVIASHLQIAQTILSDCIEHTELLMAASGTGVTLADLGLKK